MHLVVLDDDEPIAQFMATVASSRGWTARAVIHEAEFQALIRADPPDAIILDLQLGASDGVEQLRFLHSIGYDRAIVLTSGFDARVLASAEQIGNSLGLSIVAVVEKPARAARISEVLAAIERGPAAAASRAEDPQPVVRSVSPNDVAEAIAGDRMALHLQPIVSANGHAVTGAEALLRWQDPVLGPVAPEQFIAAAEQDGDVIDRLTMWVAETAVAQYRRLAEHGSPIQVGINISNHSLRSHDFPDRMAAVLERLSTPPGAIGLEVTESVAMHDLDATTAVLTRLRLKGFTVALDDFGTGHSSLTALRRMPFSAIKIDKSFVAEVETSNDSLTIVRSVIQLARDMRLTSVAEGVPSANAARMLTDLGIDGLQGHHFSPPLPFDAFVTWLREWSRDHPARTPQPDDGRA
jgi:EAL domain-containing protein (putative c-di-GMP-specific phosphodiesterase class I)/ActR/RegA family two-component response regulator